jgi:hypothetical protein
VPSQRRERSGLPVLVDEELLRTVSPVFSSSKPDEAVSGGAGTSSSACPVFVTADRCAAVSATTSVAVTRSPGFRPSSSLASRSLKGIVMRGMNPLLLS